MDIDSIYAAHPGRATTCPRRRESFRPLVEGRDKYRDSDACCTYCGSLDPDVLMARLEAGDVELGPTDKSYKVYVHNRGGEAFKQSFRGDNCPGGEDPSKWVWTTRERQDSKFYFQHLSEPQMRRFIELLNENKLHIGMPGHFYVRPFFIRYEPAPEAP